MNQQTIDHDDSRAIDEANQALCDYYETLTGDQLEYAMDVWHYFIMSHDLYANSLESVTPLQKAVIFQRIAQLVSWYAVPA